MLLLSPVSIESVHHGVKALIEDIDHPAFRCFDTSSQALLDRIEPVGHALLRCGDDLSGGALYAPIALGSALQGNETALVVFE